MEANPLFRHPPINELLELTFCESLSPQHFLIGNEYQLNLLSLSRVLEDSGEGSSEWTLAYP
jgi:hypothetical protein